MSKFSFQYIVDEATAQVAKEIIRLQAEAFGRWRATRPHLALERAFAAWWLQRGPTNFTTAEDSRLFKEHVWKHVSSLSANAPEAPTDDLHAAPEGPDTPRI